MYKIGDDVFFTDMEKASFVGRVIEVHIYKEQEDESYYLLVENRNSGQKAFFELSMNKERQEALNQYGRSCFGNVTYVRDVDVRPKTVGTTS